MVGRHFTRRGQEAVFRVFSIDAQLHGMALCVDGLLGPTHLLATRNANLFLHDIDPRAHLSDRMFHLNAGVHLKEIEVQVLVDQKLHRTSIAIADGLAQTDSCVKHLLTFSLRQGWRWRLFDDLLVTALDRAFAFMQMNHITKMVGQHLHLDMTRILNILFDEYGTIAKVFLSFA